MGELLGKERTPKEIEAGLDGIGALVNLHHAITGEQCPRHLAVGMATSAVSSLQFRCRALEAERDEKAGVAEVYYNTMTSYENDNRELRTQLREVEARETVLANTLAEHYEIDATECKAVSAFRVRAIEAVRARMIDLGPSRANKYIKGAAFNDGLEAAVNELEFLPATSERLTNEDKIAIARQQAADLNHGD